MSQTTLEPSAPALPGEHAATPAPWYRPTGTALLFLALAFFAVQTARRTMLDDPGLGWHLRNVDAMIAEGGWLTADPFSGPRAGQRWYTNQWLGDLALWLGWRWAGLEGIAAVAALVIAFTLVCLYRMLLRDGLPWPLAVLWTVLAAMGTSCSWAARPNLFTLLFVMLTARVCVRFHEGGLSRRRTFWLVPLFLVWANTHGGFVAGFLVLGITLAVEWGTALLARDWSTRWQAVGRGVHLLLVFVCCFLATLVNPYGIRLYGWVFQLLGDPYFMNLNLEWKPPDFHGKGAMRFELLILLFPFLLAVSKRRPTLVEIALSVAWLHFALTGFRYVALWVVVTVPLLARSSLHVPWVQDWLRKLREGEGNAFASRPVDRPGWLWGLAVVVALFGWARWAEGRFAYHKQEIIPSRALDELLRIHEERTRVEGKPPVIFHAYDWGGYLTWHGWPRVRNWIDDRNEVQGKEHIEAYFALLRAEPGWKETFRAADVSLVCVFPQAPLAERLGEEPDWEERYRDEHAVIFERKLPE
jgi:hypothetical protein